MKNSYLLLDYGNSLIKAAIYEPTAHKIVEWKTISKTQNSQDLLAVFTCLNEYKIAKIIVSSTASSSFTKPFLEGLSKTTSATIKVIIKDDFIGIIDFCNIKSDVIIGTDILLSAYYGMASSPKGAVFCFGTVYFGIAYDSKTIISVQLIPNIILALQDIANKTTITKELLPQKFDQQIGLNTPDAFSSGINLTMEGFVDNAVKQFAIEPNNVIISGGDANKFASLSKYKHVDNVVLLALAMLIKQKGW